MVENEADYVPVSYIDGLFGFDRNRIRKVMDDYVNGNAPGLEAIMIRQRTRYKINKHQFLNWYRQYLYAKVDEKIADWDRHLQAGQGTPIETVNEEAS
jgi:hypothetical protein